MTRTKRIAPVQSLFDDNERRLAQSLVAFERRATESEAKLNELERYRSEYEKQFTQRAGRGIGATDLRDYQAFLARLNEAIRQQQTLVQRAQAERDAELQRWQDAARRAKALGLVVEGWRVEERRANDRRDQHETDERAQRKVSIL
ncbi:MAG: flagellar export protein FliJ [Steroidobacter sp.]